MEPAFAFQQYFFWRWDLPALQSWFQLSLVNFKPKSVLYPYIMHDDAFNLRYRSARGVNLSFS